MKQLSGSSQPSVYSSFAQLPVTISNPTHLNLPDPNSIGVPPPDNLPFPGKLYPAIISSISGPIQNIVSVSHKVTSKCRLILFNVIVLI